MAGTGTISTFSSNVHNLHEICRALRGIRKQVPIASYDWSGSVDFATDKPGANDDITKGWRVGSVIIFDTVIFFCTRNTEGGAYWQQVGATNTTDGGAAGVGDIDSGTDYLIVWDESASKNKRVTIEDAVNAAPAKHHYTLYAGPGIAF